MISSSHHQRGVATRRANSLRKVAELRHIGQMYDRREPRYRSEFAPEHGIPLPERRPPQRKQFPFAQMRPGDSFVVATNLLKVNAYHEARRRGLKVTTERTEDGRYRVWLMGTVAPRVAAPPMPAF